MRPVADSHRFQQRVVQYCQVAGEPGDTHAAQGSECLGHGCAHEPQGRAVGCQAAGIGVTPVQGSGDAGHEGCVVGEPPVHVGYPLDREPAGAERLGQLLQAGVGAGLHGGGLLPDAGILGCAVAHRAAHAGESEHDITADLTADRRPPLGVVPEQDHRR